MIHEGVCHCERIRATFETDETPAALGVRTCQCAFCRRHGAVNVSDPSGLTTIDADASNLYRYVFALRTADFLICRTCGVYVAAVMGRGERIRSTINIVGLRMTAFSDIPEAPMEYGAESPEERIARRYDRWTPTRFADPDLAAADFGPH